MKFFDLYNNIILFEAEETEKVDDEEKDKETDDKEKVDKEEKDDKESDTEKDDKEEKEEVDLDTDYSPEEDESSDEEKIQAEIEEKFDNIGTKVIDKFKSVFAKKTTDILNMIEKQGIDEVMNDFIRNSYLKSVTDEDEKLFLAINMLEFIMYVSQRISVEFLKK